jgi:hypothetical protein
MSSLFIIITDRPNSPTTHTLFAKKVHFRSLLVRPIWGRVRFFSAENRPKKSENFYLGPISTCFFMNEFFHFLLECKIFHVRELKTARNHQKPWKYKEDLLKKAKVSPFRMALTRGWSNPEIFTFFTFLIIFRCLHKNWVSM